MNKLFFLLLCMVSQSGCVAQKKQLSIPIIFENICKEEENILNKNLVNAFAENYTITKFKYYVSNIKFVTDKKIKNTAGVYLIDASKKNIISIIVPSEKVSGISFLLGVDSILNCSGAQSGALDPLNDMFWTWNNGYIFFKLEGSSDVSTADLKRIEHHIGGFKGSKKTMREIYLPINNPALLKQKKLVIQLDIDKYWNGINKIRIAETPVVALPGIKAKNVADNFAGMFSIKNNL